MMIRINYTLALDSMQNIGKVNFSLEQAMKAQRGSRGISPLFL
jgi:hypothetical protein